MTSEARERALAEDSAQDDAAVLATDADQRPDDDEAPARARRGLRRRRTEAPGDDAADDEAGPADGADDVDRDGRTRPSVPLVPVLAVLLVLLLGATAWLWFTRPSTSSVRTADYVGVLQAARSEVVDLTSFDYLTLDDDIAEAKRITTGDLQKETLDRFDASRQQLTDAQAVVQTEVIGAAVTRADASHGTVRLVIQSTQKTSADAQAQVVRYRIQAELTRTGGRWVLSGLTGR